MLNLEELTLAIFVQDRTFLNDTSLYNEILVYMGQLNIFNFWICTDKMKDDSIDHLSKDDIQQTFINIIFKQVECIVNNLYCSAQCHVFSLPFMFNYFDYIVCFENVHNDYIEQFLNDTKTHLPRLTI
ncbi:unnamed protein product [Rotaria sp. Silwood1]|nr:unnamed protein product [Rotaria sp. Silwood1]CAF0928897.1 unnamed protein product [Rotaria sp. Silwood1]CAF1113556.1 unnamed protein product [Rotaria sp. Silwood1]CAF3344586.1 unnamed protein product [Rotaria sp. Silwood1]CAF3368035.1 unnamed protein product [Rotaria sp. Silwood1]